MQHPTRTLVSLDAGIDESAVRGSLPATTEIQNTCGDGFTTTTVLDGSSAPPTFPLRMDGVMKISPALTADGHFRLARMAMSGPQYASFVRLRTCTGTPPPASCNAGDPDQATMPAHVTVTGFSAEMLIGNLL